MFVDKGEDTLKRKLKKKNQKMEQRSKLTFCVDNLKI